MARKYFGTDGIRGRVGEHPMTVDFALRLASAAARVLRVSHINRPSPGSCASRPRACAGT
jgi:phosphomannomutase